MPRSREPALAAQPQRKTFGDPFSFGSPLLLNSQPQPALLPVPRAAATAATAAAASAPATTTSSRNNNGRTTATSYHRGGTTAAAATTTGRKPVGGYGVTPPAAYPAPGPPLMRTVATSPVPSLVAKTERHDQRYYDDSSFTFHVAPAPIYEPPPPLQQQQQQTKSPTKSRGVQASMFGGGGDGGHVPPVFPREHVSHATQTTTTKTTPTVNTHTTTGEGAAMQQPGAPRQQTKRVGRLASRGKVESWLTSSGSGVGGSGDGRRGGDAVTQRPRNMSGDKTAVAVWPKNEKQTQQEQQQRRQRRTPAGDDDAGTRAAAAASAAPKVAFGGRPPKRPAASSSSSSSGGPKPKLPSSWYRNASEEDGSGVASSGAHVHPAVAECDYFSAPPAQLMMTTTTTTRARAMTSTSHLLPSSVLSMDDLDAEAAAGAKVKASEEACGAYQPPPRKQVGPAFSFGVKTHQSRNSMLFSGPGKDSPGPAAYDAVIPTSDAVKGHVPVPTFGKPPKSSGGRDGGGGVWGGGGDRSDGPGPGEYFDLNGGAWGQMGRSGPSFTFGGGGGGGKGARGGKGGASSSSSSSFSVPGPGSYHRDDDDDDNDAGDKAGGRAVPGFSFGGRTGKAWDAAGPGGDAPGPGAYYNDLHQLGRGVADRVKGPGSSPAFSFGTGPRLDSSSLRHKPGEVLPGPGDYASDSDYGGGGGGSSATGSGVAGGNTGGSSVGGFTFGYRRPEGGASKKSSGGGGGGLGDSVGPGHYYSDPLEDDPGMLREGPAFTMGGRLRHGGGAVSDPRDAADTPGPGEYDVSCPSSSAAPAYTIAGRTAPAGSSARDLAAAADAPGPGQYDVVARASASAANAPSYTMAGRLTADTRLRAAAQVPGPGEYGAPMPVGAEIGGGGGAAAAGGRAERGYSIAGRESWARRSVGGGGDTPGPADYVAPPGANARPKPNPPSYSMGERTKVFAGENVRDSDEPGPGEYFDADRGGGGGGGGPSFTFGHRTVGSGAMGNLKDAAAVPGPGAYDVLGDGDGGEGVKTLRGYTIGQRTKHPSEMGAGGGADHPGPGEYYDEDRDGIGGGNRRGWGSDGFTIAGRTTPVGAAAAVWFPGMESPGPAAYDAAAQPPGALFSFGVKTKSDGAFSGGGGGGADTPGPGAYGAPVTTDDLGELVKGAPAYSFGVRGSFGAPAPPCDGPGPGGAGDGGGGAKAALSAPKFSFGLRTSAGSPFAPTGGADAASCGGGGPGEYNPDQAQSSVSRKSAGFTMGFRTKDSFAAGGGGNDPETPGPGSYDVAEAAAARERGVAPGGILEAGVRFPTAVRRDDDFRAGVDSPGPAYFPPCPDDVKGGGPKGPKGFSMGTAQRSDLAAAAGAGANAPGVGTYDVDKASRAMETGSSKVVRGVSIASRPAEKDSRADYDTPVMYGDGMAPTPGMGDDKRRGVTLGGRDAWEKDKALEKKGDTPGPQHYAPSPGVNLPRAPSHSMGVRGVTSTEAALAAAAETPAPGDYEVSDLDAIGAGAGVNRGITMGVKRPEKDKQRGLDYPAPGEYHPDETDELGNRGRSVSCPVDIGKSTGRDAVGGVFDAAMRSGADAPGPGDYHPDEDDEGEEKEGKRRPSLVPPKGPHFGKPPPKTRAIPAVDLHAPSPGEYEPDAAPPRPRSRAGNSLPGPTISKTKRTSTLVEADAGNVPGPGEFDILYHPKTIAGAAREALKQPGGMGKPPKPPTAPRSEGAVYRPPKPPSRLLLGPGPGEYEANEDPNLAPHRGVTIKTREAWESGRGGGGGGKDQITPGPGTYAPSYGVASNGLRVGGREPEFSDDPGPDYPDSFRSGAVRGGGERKGVRFA